jgi:hypothetical protein
VASPPELEAGPQLATAERIEFLFQRLQTAFLRIGYLHETNPDHIMFAYRRFLGRAGLEERDVRILLALARQVEWFGAGGWKTMAQRGAGLPESSAETAAHSGGSSSGEEHAEEGVSPDGDLVDG